MEFSYELSKKEEKAGSPEKPLSDLGFVGYQSYWAHTILKFLRDFSGQSVSIMDITRWTSILPEDIYNTLKFLNLIKTKRTANENEQSDHNLTEGKAPACEDNSHTSIDSNGQHTGLLAYSNHVSTSTVHNDIMNYDVLIYAPTDLVNSLLLNKYPESKIPVHSERLHWAPLYVVDPKKDKWSLRSLASDGTSKDNKSDNTVFIDNAFM
jgi:hypothetical protein